MKNIVLLLVMILQLHTASAWATDKVEEPKTCKICGMDRTAFAHSRMLVVYKDGAEVGLCSLHCAAAELQHNKDKLVGALMVADYSAKNLLDARKAIWVVGGKKPGVMTDRAKWAFAGKEEALSFVEENGGELTSFDQAMNSAVTEVTEQAAEELAVEKELLREQHYYGGN